MPEEAFCPTCKCNVIVTQQGTCPLGHPLDAAVEQPAAAATVPASDYGAPAPPPIPGVDTPAEPPADAAVAAPEADPFDTPPPMPATESSLPSPNDSDFIAESDDLSAAAAPEDPLASPPPEGVEMAASAGDKKQRKVSPVLVIVLVIVLILAGAGAAIMFFAPELIGLALIGAAWL